MVKNRIILDSNIFIALYFRNDSLHKEATLAEKYNATLFTFDKELKNVYKSLR